MAREASTRSLLRAVAVPTEHGGWGLTLEPAVLGLLLCGSVSGALVAGAALVAFMARTPLKLAMVDRHRRRRLGRTRMAERVAFVETTALAALAVAAVRTSARPFWPVLVAAAPLFLVEAWFDVRSRSRRLVPELAGAGGVGAVAAMVVLAGGGATGLALGAWGVCASRSAASVPHARRQVARAHGRSGSVRAAAVGALAAVALVGLAIGLDQALWPVAVGIGAMLAAQAAEARRPPVRAVVVGVRQVVLGLVVVLVTAVGHRFV